MAAADRAVGCPGALGPTPGAVPRGLAGLTPCASPVPRLLPTRVHEGDGQHCGSKRNRSRGQATALHHHREGHPCGQQPAALEVCVVDDGHRGAGVGAHADRCAAVAIEALAQDGEVGPILGTVRKGVWPGLLTRRT